MDKGQLMFIYNRYIKLQSVCVFMCSCLCTGLTAAPINLIFGIHTHIRCSCVIGYMILIFEVIKGHFRSNVVSLPGTGAGGPSVKRQKAWVVAHSVAV